VGFDPLTFRLLVPRSTNFTTPTYALSDYIGYTFSLLFLGMGLEF